MYQKIQEAKSTALEVSKVYVHMHMQVHTYYEYITYMCTCTHTI